MTYRVLIVDDEAAAREEVEFLLRRYSDFLLVDKADSVDAALAAMSLHRPDVLFLDIQLPGKDAFDLVDQLRSMAIKPAIVFITAYDQYAIRAVKESALDYLLKPIDPQEFDLCIRKIRSVEYTNSPASLSGLVQKLRHPLKLAFNNRAGTVFIDPEEIIYCKADGNYSEIHTGQCRVELVTMNLGEVTKLLSHTFFIRLGRSYILNMKYLEKIIRAKRVVVLQKDRENYEVQLSKNMLRQLEEAVTI